METSKSNKKLNLESDTHKKSEVATSDDQKSLGTTPKALVQATSTPAKAGEQRSRLAPKPVNDQPKPPTSV